MLTSKKAGETGNAVFQRFLFLLCSCPALGEDKDKTKTPSFCRPNLLETKGAISVIRISFFLPTAQLFFPTVHLPLTGRRKLDHKLSV
ncbi:hypothetical protein QQP08_027197 [Theobroma cacao]|nr:hypothetical protein QQP08_027197 [Theobroma cacao]